MYPHMQISPLPRLPTSGEKLPVDLGAYLYDVVTVVDRRHDPIMDSGADVSLSSLANFELRKLRLKHPLKYYGDMAALYLECMPQMDVRISN